MFKSAKRGLVNIISGLLIIGNLGCAGQSRMMHYQAMNHLGENDPHKIVSLPKGYKTHEDLAIRLENLSIIYAGTGRVKKINGGYVVVGDGNLLSEEELPTVSRHADRYYPFKIIDEREVEELEEKVYGAMTK